MQFQVPQFIDVEDKIFGPLTFKQFVYITGGAGFSYMLWRLLPQYASVPLIAVVGGFAAALAFVEWNGQPFIVALENGFFFLVHKKLYLWNNARSDKARPTVVAKAGPAETTTHQPYVPKLSDSRLHELAWALDINERIAAGTLTSQEREAQKANILRVVRTARQAYGD